MYTIYHDHHTFSILNMQMSMYSLNKYLQGFGVVVVIGPDAENTAMKLYKLQPKSRHLFTIYLNARYVLLQLNIAFIRKIYSLNASRMNCKRGVLQIKHFSKGYVTLLNKYADCLFS